MFQLIIAVPILWTVSFAPAAAVAELVASTASEVIPKTELNQSVADPKKKSA